MAQGDAARKDAPPPKKLPPLPSAADEATLIGTPAPPPPGARPGGAPPPPRPALPTAAHRRTTIVAAPPKPPEITATFPEELRDLVDPTLIAQDLTRDKLLEHAAHAKVGDKVTPMVGGIPLFVKLGQGGMGAVYYGIHPADKGPRAVKIVPVESANKETIQRFYNEARIAATLKSPHLVPVKDLGESKGLYYVVTDFVPGISAGAYLLEVCRTGATGLPETEALDAIIAAVRGLVEAHKNGIIHGDVRPENILIPRAASSGDYAFNGAQLADLGLPRVEEMGGVLTGSNAALGTPGYMAPEQAVDAKAARKQSDVFSIGATLYTLLAGRPPFPMDNPMTTIMHTIQTPHDPVTKFRKEVSPATSELLDRCLAKRPTERYVDASALLEALTVCRQALTEPQMTQRTAIKRITMVLEKSSEVGQKVIGTDSATPSSMPFLAELSNAPQAAAEAKKTAGPGALPARKEAKPEPPSESAAEVATKKHAPVQVPQPAQLAPSRPARPKTVAGFNKTVVYAFGALIFLLAVTALFLALRGGGQPTPEVAVKHFLFLQDARKMALNEPEGAASLLEEARLLKMSDPKSQQQERAVESLIRASQLLNKGAEPDTVRRILDDVEKAFPSDPTVDKLREKIRQKRDKRNE